MIQMVVALTMMLKAKYGLQRCSFKHLSSCTSVIMVIFDIGNIKFLVLILIRMTLSYLTSKESELTGSVSFSVSGAKFYQLNGY